MLFSIESLHKHGWTIIKKGKHLYDHLPAEMAAAGLLGGGSFAILGI